jgi:hypothetical protein
MTIILSISFFLSLGPMCGNLGHFFMYAPPNASEARNYGKCSSMLLRLFTVSRSFVVIDCLLIIFVSVFLFFFFFFVLLLFFSDLCRCRSLRHGSEATMPCVRHTPERS